jgi:hypothetical protein
LAARLICFVSFFQSSLNQACAACLTAASPTFMQN